MAIISRWPLCFEGNDLGHGHHIKMAAVHCVAAGPRTWPSYQDGRCALRAMT